VRPWITEDEIRALVFSFYGAVREDATLGPMFEARLEGVWPAHLEKMCDFWSSVLLATGRFRGNPVQTHASMTELRPYHFPRWIELFGATAHDVLRPDVATAVIDMAARIRRALESHAPHPSREEPR
jgi:hemoglobin